MDRDFLKRKMVSSPFKRWYYHYVYWRIFKRDRGVIKTMIENRPKTDRPSLLKMWWVVVVKLWLPEEYVSFRYDFLSRKGRKQYVLNWEKDCFCQKVNNKYVLDLLDDKYRSFCLLKDYYSRDVIEVDFSKKNLDAVSSFFSVHPKAIVKLNKSGGGHGIFAIDSNDFKSVEALFAHLENQCKSKKIIIEEMIRQDDRMACFHPRSVNTLRMPAIRIGEEIVLFRPFMRIGRGDTIVDNGGSGGILAAIDIDTGMIKAAATEDGTEFCFHPDTKTPIIGFIVPMWKEAQAYTKKLMQALPEGVYVSWDLALSDKGWTTVEGNGRGQFIGQQLPFRQGIRTEFNEILNRLNL